MSSAQAAVKRLVSPFVNGRSFKVEQSKEHMPRCLRMLIMSVILPLLPSALRDLCHTSEQNIKKLECGPSPKKEEILEKTNEFFKEFNNMIARKKIRLTLPENFFQSKKMVDLFEVLHEMAVPTPGDLRNKKGERVYGEMSISEMMKVLRKFPIGKNQVFVDLGSGVGQLVALVAAVAQCRSVGIEIEEKPAKFAAEFRAVTMSVLPFFGRQPGPMKMYCGDILEARFVKLVTQQADLLVVNNLMFPSNQKLNGGLLLLLQQCKVGANIISTGDVFFGKQLEFAVEREKLEVEEGNVNWTHKGVQFHSTRIMTPIDFQAVKGGRVATAKKEWLEKKEQERKRSAPKKNLQSSGQQGIPRRAQGVAKKSVSKPTPSIGSKTPRAPRKTTITAPVAAPAPPPPASRPANNLPRVAKSKPAKAGVPKISAPRKMKPAAKNQAKKSGNVSQGRARKSPPVVAAPVITAPAVSSAVIPPAMAPLPVPAMVIAPVAPIQAPAVPPTPRPLAPAPSLADRIKMRRCKAPVLAAPAVTFAVIPPAMAPLPLPAVTPPIVLAPVAPIQAPIIPPTPVPLAPAPSLADRIKMRGRKTRYAPY